MRGIFWTAGEEYAEPPPPKSNTGEKSTLPPALLVGVAKPADAMSRKGEVANTSASKPPGEECAVAATANDERGLAGTWRSLDRFSAARRISALVMTIGLLVSRFLFPRCFGGARAIGSAYAFAAVNMANGSIGETETCLATGCRFTG